MLDEEKIKNSFLQTLIDLHSFEYERKVYGEYTQISKAAAETNLGEIWKWLADSLQVEECLLVLLPREIGDQRDRDSYAVVVQDERKRNSPVGEEVADGWSYLRNWLRNAPTKLPNLGTKHRICVGYFLYQTFDEAGTRRFAADLDKLSDLLVVRVSRYESDATVDHLARPNSIDAASGQYYQRVVFVFGCADLVAAERMQSLAEPLVKQFITRWGLHAKEQHEVQQSKIVGAVEGKETAFKRMQEATGHELAKIYIGAENAMDRVNLKCHLNTEILFAFNVSEAALSYGLLWASTSEPLDFGSNTSDFARGVLQKAWSIFLGGQIVYTDADLMTVSQIARLNELWSIGENINRFTLCENGVADSLLPDMPLRRSLFRWHLVALVNALKHAILSNPTANIEHRLQDLEKCLLRTDPILNYLVTATDGGITFSVTNSVLGDVKKSPSTEHSTGLALRLAKEEIEARLQKKHGSDTRITAMEFRGSASTWTTSLTVPIILTDPTLSAAQ